MDETYDGPVPDPFAPLLTIDQAHAVFRRWLGEAFDLAALDVVLAAAAVEQLDGDPVWLLLVSGSGNAKTETVGALAGAGALVISTVSSEGALLSATSQREKAKDATGGLLRQIGARGLLVVKDVTSILSMNADQRGQVLAALREVYDGRWTRTVGTDGGKTLSWSGRLVLIGAVTTAYDRAHGVIAAMGDRFALVRVDSHEGRLTSGRQALRNVGAEVTMRAELAEAAGGVLANIEPSRAVLREAVMDRLLRAADVVTLARTAVEKDGKGQPEWAHAPEAPTRFAKMLGQLVRGSLALGLDEESGMAGALRVARDSVPPMRLRCLLDVLEHPGARTSDVVKRTQQPRSTIDRTLQELHLLGLVHVDQLEGSNSWHYSVAEDVSREALADLANPPSVTGNTTTRTQNTKEGRVDERSDRAPVPAPSGISGYAEPDPDDAEEGVCWGCNFPLSADRLEAGARYHATCEGAG